MGDRTVVPAEPDPAWVLKTVCKVLGRLAAVCFLLPLVHLVEGDLAMLPAEIPYMTVSADLESGTHEATLTVTELTGGELFAVLMEAAMDDAFTGDSLGEFIFNVVTFVFDMVRMQASNVLMIAIGYTLPMVLVLVALMTLVSLRLGLLSGLFSAVMLVVFWALAGQVPLVGFGAEVRSEPGMVLHVGGIAAVGICLLGVYAFDYLGSASGSEPGRSRRRPTERR